MNSVMGCLADCAEMLPEDAYYSEYCGGRIRGRGEAPSDTIGRDQLSHDDASDDIWSDDVAVPTVQRVRSGSEPGQRTGESEVVTRPRSSNQYQAARPHLPRKRFPAAAERAARAQERAARAFALAEEAARAAKAAEETADRAVKAAEIATADKLAGRPRSLEFSGACAGLARSPADRSSVNCSRDIPHPRRGGDGDGGGFVLRKGEPLPSRTASPKYIAPRTTVLSPLPNEREIDGTKRYIHKDEIKEKQKQEGRRLGPGIGRMDSAAESDGGHAMADGADGSWRRKSGPRMSTASIAKPTVSPARLRDVSRHRERGRQQGRVTVTVGAARTLGGPRRRSRTPSVELSEVSDSDLSGLMVETVATTPSHPKAPAENDSAVTRVSAPGRRDWEVEGTNGSEETGRRRDSSTEKDRGCASEGANACSGVGGLKANSEVAWHGHMHDRAAIMGAQWRQLAEPKMELDSKLSSLSTDSSVTESHMDPDSLTRRSPSGATASDSRFNRIWAQSPEERDKTQSRARSATRCKHVTTHLRNIELSQDGTILTVRPGGGKSQFEFTLADLLEVKENPSEETVTLVGKSIKISIAFKGQAVALQHFSATLVPALRQGVLRDCDRDPHDAEGGSRRGRPKSTVREDEAKKLVLEEGRSSSDSDDEDLPISHPERLTPSSSIAAASNHTTRTRASTGSKSLWIMDSDKPVGASAAGWDTLTASPVVSISSTSSSAWDRGGPIGKSFSHHVPITEEWELGEPSDRFESLRELPPSRSPRSLLSSAQCQAEREERKARRREQRGKRPDSASVEQLSSDAIVAPVAQTSAPPPEEHEEEEGGVKSNGGSTRPGEATLCEAGKLLRDARKAKRHTRARLQEEGVRSRLYTSGGSSHHPVEETVEGILEDDQVEAKVPNDREQSMSNAGHRIVPVVGSEKLCCGEREKHWMESPESPPSGG